MCSQMLQLIIATCAHMQVKSTINYFMIGCKDQAENQRGTDGGEGG